MARDEHFEEVLERIIRWMMANPEACRELEAQLETITTDFGDIKIVPDRFVTLHTIRPNDLAPEITQFERVTDELKPKVRDGSG